MFPEKKILALVMTFFVTKRALGYVCTYYVNLQVSLRIQHLI